MRVHCDVVFPLDTYAQNRLARLPTPAPEMLGAFAVTMPSDESHELGWFDRFADWVASFTSRAWFFALCVLIVVVWAPSYFVFQSVDTWQLIINTATTIVTFLLVALLQNTQKRGDDAVHQKLNALAQFLVSSDTNSPASDELRQAIGIERRESSS